MAHQYDLAIEYLQRTLELEPDVVDGHRGLGEVYVQKGMHDEAIKHLQKYVELTKAGPTMRSAISATPTAWRASARKHWKSSRRCKIERRGNMCVPYAFAPLYVGLGENDKAIEALWRDYEEEHHAFLLWLKVFPVFDPLHSEPRFIELLRKIGVEPQ